MRATFFATAHMLGFSALKCTRFPYGRIGKHERAMNVSENMRPRFAGVLLKLTSVRILPKGRKLSRDMET